MALHILLSNYLATYQNLQAYSVAFHGSNAMIQIVTKWHPMSLQSQTES